MTALIAAVTIAMATAAFAELGQNQEGRPRIWVGGEGGYGRFRREPPKWATPANFDGSFNFCRGYFTADRRE
ncbi:MAG: hypothetical protein DMF96_24490, partial [Acidobacteria bacterium]